MKNYKPKHTLTYRGWKTMLTVARWRPMKSNEKKNKNNRVQLDCNELDILANGANWMVGDNKTEKWRLLFDIAISQPNGPHLLAHLLDRQTERVADRQSGLRRAGDEWLGNGRPKWCSSTKESAEEAPRISAFYRWIYLFIYSFFYSLYRYLFSYI